MSISLPSQQLRSSQRPIPLRSRADLDVQPIEYQGVTHFVVKDPVALTYNRLRCDQFRVLQLLDGRRHLEEIKEVLVREFPAIAPTLRDVQQLIMDLHQKGLVYGERTGQGVTRIEQHRKKRRQMIWTTFTNILSLRLPGWDPDVALAALLRWNGWMFHPVTVLLASIVVVGSWLLLATQFSTFQSRLPAFNQFFGWPNLIFLWITLAGAKIFHEFGHGLMCKYFGGECHEMGIMLLVGSPCLYCDVSDSWMLKNKWARILIGAGGMIFEVVLSAFAIIIWWMTDPGLLHYLCLNLFFVTAVSTVIFNANPLMRLDGYYMLMDFLEIPNLRPKADKLLREAIAKLCLGIDSHPDPFMPQTGRLWFMLFTIASNVYGWIVLFGILTFLYTVLKPYGLQSIGQTIAAISLAGIVSGLIMNGYRMVKAPRQQPISRWRLAISLTVIAASIAFLGTIPIPLIRSAAFVIEPRDVRHVYNQVPGELVEILVQPGDQVVAGQLLARLYESKLEDRRYELLITRDVQSIEIRLANALEDSSARIMAEESVQTADLQLAELAEQSRHLSITAPIAGTIIAPPRQPQPKIQQMRARLGGWTGTPLDPKNAGSFLEVRTHLFSIAPSDAMQAILFLDQEDRHDISLGLPIGLKFDHLPDQVFRGTISKIATAHSDFAPEHLSVKHGGLMSTVSDSDGKEKLQDAAYQATVILEDSTDDLKSHLRGNARFIAARRSAFSWLWRYVRRTFHFRM